MPEVIEIRKYVDFLQKYILNKKIKNINILKGKYKRLGPFDKYKILTNNLPLKVVDIKNKGKFLYIILDKGFYIFTTLGLTGGWTFYDNKTKKYIFPKLIDYIPNDKMEQYKKTALNNLNIEITVSGGKLYFYDSLSFGTIKVVDTNNNLNKKLKQLAPDIMNTNTTFKVFKEQIEKTKYKNKPIGLVLMDQKFISGMGNYLRSDILWLSRISPYRKVQDLTNIELKKIYKNARLLTWGDYNFKQAVKKNIIKSTNKLPKHYKRNFFAYYQDKDIYGNPIKKEPLYTGKLKRFIYWVPSRQK